MLSGKVRAAEFSYKLAHPNPVDFPQSVWTVQMAKAIKEQTHGRMEITIYPNAILGSQTALVGQLRLGSIQFMEAGTSTYSGLVPVSSIDSVGFAFSSSQAALGALDGPLGAYVRNEFASKGLYVFPKAWDYGIRQTTSSTHPIRTAADYVGFKLRTQPSAILVDLFKTLGANPVPLDATQLYTGLQTHLLDGQENSLAVVETFRLYEVQKYVSITNGSWSGSWLVANGEAWNALPEDIRAVIEANAAKYALAERADSRAFNVSVADKLKRQGLVFNTADSESIRSKLAPYYARWKNEFGPTAWGLLEAAVGKLG